MIIRKNYNISVKASSLLLLLALSMMACSKKKSIEEQMLEKLSPDSLRVFLPPIETEPQLLLPSSFPGIWEYGFPFYSSELIIKKDGTFTFYDQGCTSKGYSEGTWTDDGFGIILKSYPRYNESTPLEILEIKQKKETISLPSDDSIIKLEIDPSLFNTGFEFKRTDTSNIYFDNARLRLDGFYLHELDKNGMKTDTKYKLLRQF